MLTPGLKLQHLLKIQEGPGSATYSRSGEREGLWRSVWRSAYVCWPQAKNKRFLNGNVHPRTGWWKLWPELCYWSLFKVSCILPAQVGAGVRGTCEAPSHLHPTMLITCWCMIARTEDLLVASAGPLSLASFDCRSQGREERGEPPQRWGLGLFALCYQLGFDVLFWRRKKTWVF